MHYLHEYINKEMKTILYKTKSDKKIGLGLRSYCVSICNSITMFFWRHIFYRYDIVNNVTQDIELCGLDLWKQWLTNQFNFTEY